MMPSRRSMRQPLSTVQETDVTIEDSGQGAQSTRRSISSLLESSRGSVLGSENMEKTIGTPSSTTTAKSLASDGKKMNDPRLPIAQEYLSNDAVLLRKCRLLLDVRDELLRAMNDDPLLEAEFLTHSEMALIFSKIETFVALYEPLVTELERAIENWTGVKAFCKAILSRSDELKSAYPPYITKNDEIKATLDGRMKQSPRLMEFIRNIERRPEFERSRVADLLMAPVQRLPQSLATLKEMAKKSSIVWRGRTKVNLVTALVESVLKMANDRREHNDKMMELLSLLNNIDGLPSTMVSAQQSLTMSADAISLGGCIMPGRLGSRVRIYCFAHGLTVVKVRSEETSLDQTLMMPGPSRNSNSHGGGMIRKLARSLSSVSLRSRPSVHLARMGGTGRKPFKFVTNISFTNIRRIRRINIGDVDDVNDDEDDEQQQQQRSLYLIVVRNNADEGWLLTADPNAPADRALLPLLEEISDTIYHTHNRIVGCDQEAVDEGYVAARSIADENLGDLIEDLNMNGSIQKAQKWLGSAIGGGGPSAMHATRNLDASTWSLTSMQSSVRLPHFHPHSDQRSHHNLNVLDTPKQSASHWMRVLRNIDGVPASLVATPESSVIEADAVSLGGSILSNQVGRSVRIYAHGMGMMVVKMRAQEHVGSDTIAPLQGGTIRRLARNLSSVSLVARNMQQLSVMQRRRPFRFVTNLALDDIQRIRRIRFDGDEANEERTLYLIRWRNEDDHDDGEGWLLVEEKSDQHPDRILRSLLEQLSYRIRVETGRSVGAEQRDRTDENQADENEGSRIDDERAEDLKSSSAELYANLQRARAWMKTAAAAAANVVHEGTFV